MTQAGLGDGLEQGLDGHRLAVIAETVEQDFRRTRGDEAAGRSESRLRGTRGGRVDRSSGGFGEERSGEKRRNRLLDEKVI